MEASVMSTACIELPNELLVLIVGFLQEDQDTASLLNCCLASRTLCSISQPHIFSFVEFEKLIAAPSSLSAVAESRHLAGYITATRVSFTERAPEPDVLRVLPLLHNVDRLELTSRHYDNEVPEILSHALQQTIFPTIKTLSINSATVSIIVLTSFCPMLIHLLLDDVPPLSHEQGPELYPILPALRSITINHYDAEDFEETSSLSSLLHPAQHNIDTLILGLSHNTFLLPYRPTFLEQFGHSLVHLYISEELFDHIMENPSLPAPLFQFSQVPQLQTFHTQLPSWKNINSSDPNISEVEPYFDSLAVSLRSCHKPHPLRKLIFDVVDVDATPKAEGEGGWPKLDAVLCDRGLLPGFRSLVFKFSRVHGREERRNWIRSVAVPLSDRERLLSFSEIRDLVYSR